MIRCVLGRQSKRARARAARRSLSVPSTTERRRAGSRTIHVRGTVRLPPAPRDRHAGRDRPAAPSGPSDQPERKLAGPRDLVEVAERVRLAELVLDRVEEAGGRRVQLVRAHLRRLHQQRPRRLLGGRVGQRGPGLGGVRPTGGGRIPQALLRDQLGVPGQGRQPDDDRPGQLRVEFEIRRQLRRRRARPAARVGSTLARTAARNAVSWRSDPASAAVSSSPATPPDSSGACRRSAGGRNAPASCSVANRSSAATTTSEGSVRTMLEQPAQSASRGSTFARRGRRRGRRCPARPGWPGARSAARSRGPPATAVTEPDLGPGLVLGVGDDQRGLGLGLPDASDSSVTVTDNPAELGAVRREAGHLHRVRSRRRARCLLRTQPLAVGARAVSSPGGPQPGVGPGRRGRPRPRGSRPRSGRRRWRCRTRGRSKCRRSPPKNTSSPRWAASWRSTAAPLA